MRRTTNSQRGIAAMVTVVAFMAFAVPVTAAALSLTSTLSIDSRIKTNILDCQYGAQAGEQYARYKILHDEASLGITEESPAVLDQNFNGCDVSSQISMSSAMVAGGGMTMSDVSYTIQAGHQIEIKVTVNQDSDQHMLVAYDTTEQPAAGHFPSPGGDKTFYLHNYPSPPTGDTVIQLPLPMDETEPTATTLYNYSTDRDNDPGRFIQRGGDMHYETHHFKYQNWQTAPFASDFEIDGDITFDMWVAMNHFDPDWAGMFNICLRDFNGSTYTEIDCTTMLVDTDQWAEGGFTGVTGNPSYDVVTTSGSTVLYSRVDP